MITIDSQIWIYYWDSNAKEHKCIVNWLNGKNKDGILFNKDIILSAIIPVEVGHHLFKLADINKELDKDSVEDLLLSLVSGEYCQIIEIDLLLIIEVIQKLKDYSVLGVGGRDALILATMERFQIQTIATHDRNILSLKKYRRIDPVFDPPLILEGGEEFDYQDFNRKVAQI